MSKNSHSDRLPFMRFTSFSPIQNLGCDTAPRSRLSPVKYDAMWTSGNINYPRKLWRGIWRETWREI